MRARTKSVLSWTTVVPIGLLLLASAETVRAFELTGRFSVLGAAADTRLGDVGYTSENETQIADQQSLRLMAEGYSDGAEWAVHLRAARWRFDGQPAISARHSSDWFRYVVGGDSWLQDEQGDPITSLGYEFDRAVYRRHLNGATVGVGRQSIDWGSGRFWQPTNVFGAFSPTDLDTDYKPGIDAVSIDGYLGPFSVLTGVYAFAPHDEPDIEDSGALHYRRQLGEQSELTAVAGRIAGNRVGGGSFESAWRGMGWRVEGLFYRTPDRDRRLFWVAGVDYQFEDGTLVIAEWHDNGNGAQSEGDLAGVLGDPLVQGGLQQQLGRRLLGLGIERDLTPLLHGAYTLLIGILRDDAQQPRYSSLHQVSFTYSTGNESDLLLSFALYTGEGLDSAGFPHSEFGHLPRTVSVRLRCYF